MSTVAVEESSGRVRVRAVPESRPPALVLTGPPAPAPGQLMLELEWAGSTSVPDPVTSAVTDAPAVGAAPDAHAWSLSLARAIIEVLHGRRPPAQLIRWVDERVLAAITLHSRLRSADPRARVEPTVIRSVRVQQLSPGTAEVAVHLSRARRSTAMALRLETRGDHWVCTALELGPR
ncbi:hypothetical protein JOE57_000459 [Microlunatus panaciterrae]|uniref:Energy transducer TonB n=1 Tax=Microlunatus panaciterrae TaxID=400768 RepID=A0ABS2RFS2_9ACTN|nr:Rv3235 family protein [Microlunatus panaciterrae]MBM7797538.1 hypothetical protein [Microlunatus panaciterrae]